MTNEEAKMFLDNLKVCIDEHPVVADWLVEIANRKTESSSEKPKTASGALNMRKRCSIQCLAKSVGIGNTEQVTTTIVRCWK